MSPGLMIMSWTCTVVSSDDPTERTPGGLDGDDTANLSAKGEGAQVSQVIVRMADPLEGDNTEIAA